MLLTRVMRTYHAAVLAEWDVENLVALHALLEERHVTRAAKRLGLSQSSLSHRLRRLREQLGDPLFVRSGAALAPTPRAEAMRAPLGRALAALREAVAPPGAFDPKRSTHRLTVAMPDVLAPLVPPMLGAVVAAAPAVAVRIVSLPTALGDALAEGEPTLAFAPVPFVGERVVEGKLGALTFGVALRRGHPALGRGGLTLARWLACGHVVMRIGNAQRNPVADALAQRGLERRVALEAPSFLLGLHAVARSDLVMNAPLPIAADVAHSLGLEIRPTPIPIPTLRFALLWHERFRADPAHRWARELLLGVVRPLFARPK